jgi:hypothetical protein
MNLTKRLTQVQKDFCDSEAWYKLYRAGRQGGKTEVLVWDWGKWAMTHPNTINWYVAQDLANLKEKVIPQFESTFDRSLIKSYSKSDKCFTLFNNAKAYFKSGNSADGLRGRGIHNLAIDEAAFIVGGASVFHDILRPQLITTNGRLAVGSSPPSKRAPTGAEWFRRLENSFKEEIALGHSEYAVFHSGILDNPFVTQKEKDRILRTTDSDTYSIEYLGNYCDKVGQVYWEFDPLTKKRGLGSDSVICRVRGMDWGIADNTACVWISLLSDNRVHIEQEYVANNSDVPTHAYAIKNRTKLPPQYTILDSACWARDASLTSVAKRFAAEGIAAIQATKDFDGSVSDMKQLMAAGLITIDPSCVQILQGLDGWQHGQHEPDQLAAMRYGIDALIRAGKLLPPARQAGPSFKSWHERKEYEDKRNSKLRAMLDNKKTSSRFTMM